MAYEPIFSTILPAGVIAVSRDPGGDIGTLLPGEFVWVAKAVASRQAEFAAGRDAARRALGQLGYPPIAIPVDDRRAPIWPEGITGSISHCRGCVLAIVARVSTTLGYVGVDVELVHDLEVDLWDSICTPTELSWLNASERPGYRAKLLFSIKEAVYKAQYQLTRQMLDFHEVEVVVEDEDRFSAEIANTNLDVSGRYAADDHFIVAYASARLALEG
jgi:4'-phosphopantetheinyl transferase EntD